jgi:hypothetical protein
MNVFVIINPSGDVVHTKKSWAYTSLGRAKSAARAHIIQTNNGRHKEGRVSFEGFRVREMRLTDSEDHPITK